MSKKRETAAQRIISRIFLERYHSGMQEVPFSRDEIISTAAVLGLKRPKNIGDIIYSLRYRIQLPDSIRDCAPKGKEWAIFPGGHAIYVLKLTPINVIEPRIGLQIIRVPDATPGLIYRCAMSDEQALLARLRYNRLLDIFTGLVCYPLQSHLRTSVKVRNALKSGDSGFQVETDDLYVGIDKDGAHYVLPVQAKSGRDALSVVQIWQDFLVAEQKFEKLVARPVAAQFMDKGRIALFAFGNLDEEITITDERHYELVPAEQLSDEELRFYKTTANMRRHVD
ncbi:MAG: endonuclease [Aestuariivita sp.]|nr:endonuclease [Aestuariivita sp.]MCY4346581.1 endonuclease [Aestuariivita sp.]